MLTNWIKSENPREESVRAPERLPHGAHQPKIGPLSRHDRLRQLSNTFAMFRQSQQLPLTAGEHRFFECSSPFLAIPFLASGRNVETKFWNLLFKGGLIIAAMALAGCGTPAAKNFGGSWKPVNHFRQQPTEIPLTAAYTFYAAPLDETLKNMLTRWANDSERELSYKLPFDVTLYTPVSGIRTTNLDLAAQQLTTIYAAQGVYVSATDRKILVRPSRSTAGVFNSQAVPPAPGSVPAPATPASSK